MGDAVGNAGGEICLLLLLPGPVQEHRWRPCVQRETQLHSWIGVTGSSWHIPLIPRHGQKGTGAVRGTDRSVE